MRHAAGRLRRRMHRLVRGPNPHPNSHLHPHPHPHPHDIITLTLTPPTLPQERKAQSLLLKAAKKLIESGKLPSI